MATKKQNQTVGRPRTLDKTEAALVLSVRLPKAAVHQLESLAKKSGLRRSAMLREIVCGALAK